jgi:uncharacterized membrane protein
MSPIAVLAALGLIGLVGGTIALVFIRRVSSGTSAKPKNWRLRWTVALGTGLVLAVASFLLTGSVWLSYPIAEGQGTGHVLGIPFIAAYIDAQGSDYVGAITWISAGANALFWFMMPSVALAIHTLIWQRRQSALPVLPVH